MQDLHKIKKEMIAENLDIMDLSDRKQLLFLLEKLEFILNSTNDDFKGLSSKND